MSKRAMMWMGVVVMLVGAGAAHAVMMEPDWQRGASNTTYQRWDFGTDDTTPDPDEVINVYGTPQMTVYPIHAWEQSWEGAEGVWPLSGAIVIDIPNRPEFSLSKLMLLQVVWAPEVPVATKPVVIVEATDLNDEPVAPEDIVLVEETATDLGMTVNGPWRRSTYLFEIFPNPKSERITVSGALMVDTIVVDTICPEPASMSVLALGGLLAVLRRKR